MKNEVDPDAALAEIRSLTKSASTYDDWHRLAELVTALDEWLTNGGSLPRAWRPTE
jgi:hypothetical protein